MLASLPPPPPPQPRLRDWYVSVESVGARLSERARGAYGGRGAGGGWGEDVGEFVGERARLADDELRCAGRDGGGVECEDDGTPGLGSGRGFTASVERMSLDPRQVDGIDGAGRERGGGGGRERGADGNG